MVKINKFDIKIDGEIRNWDEALPIGNGTTGCLIYGKNPLKLAFDRIDLWDLRKNPVTQESGFNFKNLVNLAKSGSDEDWAEYTRLFDDVYTSRPYPTKISAGRVELRFADDIPDVNNVVDIKKAIAEVSRNDGKKLATFFVGADRDMCVGRVYGDFDVNIVAPEYVSDPIDGLGYPQGEVRADGNDVYYVQETLTELVYGVFVRTEKLDGVTELYVAVRTGKDKSSLVADVRAELDNAARQGYEFLEKLHVAKWQTYWKKSQIYTDNDILDKTYCRAMYLFASCSKKGGCPMPLQGVWTADNGKIPPWKGDYHFDTNVELSYQAYLKANRIDEGRVVVDYLWNNRKVYKKFAEDFYGVHGLLIPSSCALDGTPMGGWGQYAFSPTMTIWAAQSFDEYYLYCGDDKFLKTRAYPFFKDVAEAISGLLTEKDGKLYLPLSSSPEIFDNERRAYLQPNSNFDLALLTYLYKTLVGYSEKLGLDGTEYENILAKLDDIAVNADGVVMLDKNNLLPETHRHFSHLMCLYPLHLINYDTNDNKRIYNATLNHLERLGTGMWVGFSFPMSAQIYAMATQGNAAYNRLYEFCNGFVGDNGFHLNGDYKHYGYTTFHYRPITLEALYGFCDALHEMLMQDHNGGIELFPAVPDRWKKGKIGFTNLRSRGGLLVSAELVDGRIGNVTVKFNRTQTVTICGKQFLLNKGTNTIRFQ